MTFRELAVKVLTETRKPMTPDEIWEYAVGKSYAGRVGSRGKTPWSSIGAQLYVSVRDDPESPFAKTDSRPRRFYLKSIAAEVKDFDKIIRQEAEKAPSPQKPSFLEKDLYKLLAYYIHLYRKAYPKTINHTRSTKSEFADWVHPDLVSCYYPLEDWKSEAIELSEAVESIPIQIASYEVKRTLSFSNLREAFFQAVSNSSWAHESSLAAAIISENDDFRDELKRLASSFGIGVIQLDTNDPDSTTILIPAEEKDQLDWGTVNKLCMNPDFREFLKRVKTDLTSREIRLEMYDKIEDREALVELFNKR